MSKKKKTEIITLIKPHSLDKFEIIDRYVSEWARKILGMNGKNGLDGSKGVIYIDCMSNSGLYYNEQQQIIEGSAIRVARQLNSIITDYPGKKAILIFNDIIPERVDRLKEEIEKRQFNNVEVYYYKTDCNVFLRELDLAGFKKSFNTLLLYDPYNAAIDWDTLTPYLNQWGEVIINHMVYDTNLNITHTSSPMLIQRYKETYQNDIQTIIQRGTSKSELNKIIVSIIRQRTASSKYTHYIAYFPFFNRTNGLVYYLLHCCVNIKGTILFKKHAWKVFGDKSSHKDTHGNENQLTLGLIDDRVYDTDDECYYPHDIAQYIYDKYHERGEVSLTEIYDDLNQHPVFPSDGYKQSIKHNLQRMFGVEFPRGKNCAVFASKEHK